MTYGTVSTPLRGSGGGILHTMELAANEYVYRVTGKTGEYGGGAVRRVSQLTFHTNVRSFGPFGDGGKKVQNFVS